MASIGIASDALAARPEDGAGKRRLGIFDLHEVSHLPKHALDDRARAVLLDRLADLGQPERAHRAAMPRRLADRALDLGELKAPLAGAA